jgi:hypothetical protein
VSEFNVKNFFERLVNAIRSSESGNVLVISLVASGVLIGVTGLAVDYGNAVVQEAKLQKAADMSALAGIQEAPYASESVSEMQDYFDANYTRTSECQKQFGANYNTCWVVASHPVDTYFMRIFGQDTLTVQARAKAELQDVEGFSGGIGVVPFVLLNPEKNGDPTDDLNASNHGTPFVLKYAEDNIMVEDWYFGRQTVEPGMLHFSGNLPDGGWRSPLALDPDSESPYDESNSASDYCTNFADGWGGTLEIGDIIGSNPGVMTGATTQGRRDRLNGYESMDWGSFNPNQDQQNPRIIVVPVVSLGQYDSSGVWQESDLSDVSNGNYDWKYSRVDGFAAFYLLTDNEQRALPGGNDVDRKWVVGRYLHGVNIGGVIRTPGDSGGPDMGMKQGRLIPF